jgi:hypothetical protein
MTTLMAEHVDLTLNEAFLLRWLSCDDVSELGECKGTALDGLASKGLVEVAPNWSRAGPRPDFDHVTLTAAGRAHPEIE